MRPNKMLLSTALVLLGAAACGPTSSTRPRAPTHEIESIAVVPAAPSPSASATSEPSATPPRNAKQAPRCVLGPLAKAAAPPALLSGGACRTVGPTVQASIRATLSQRFEKTHDHGKPKVSFACDGLGSTVREIVIESGSGHGFGLELWRARLSEDGTQYDVRGIGYAGGGFVQSGREALGYRTASGQIDRAVIDAHLEKARSALSSEIHEELTPIVDGVDGESFSFSSADFHVLLKLTDTRGRTIEKEFTGYEGNSDQEAYLPVNLAAEELQSLTRAFPLEEHPATDDDRAFFAERFNDSARRFDESFHWWVTERYVALSKDLGSTDVARALLTRLEFTKSDRSKVDARADAVEALARITGWDARVDDAGRAVKVEDAARAYLDECSKSRPPL